MYPLLQHPDRFVWDFWYIYDASQQLFHLLFLNADPALVAENQHHFAAVIGYATTHDFTSIEWQDHQVFQADPDGWDNSSIWSGDVVRCRDGYAFWYTSRDRRQDDGMTQQIGLAVSTDFRSWQRIPQVRLTPDTRWYEPRAVADDNTTHAWRDPFMFRFNRMLYMLVAAKSRQQPPTRKGAVALLQSTDGSLTNWSVLPPLHAGGWASECEVPQLYQRDDRLVLVYSGWARHDYAPTTAGQGGLYMIEHPVPAGELAHVDFAALPQVVLAESAGLYACRVIPELGGDIVGFDLARGGLRRVAGVAGIQSLDREFTGFSIASLA
jgi:beta-fructofuranosidase